MNEKCIKLGTDSRQQLRKPLTNLHQELTFKNHEQTHQTIETFRQITKSIIAQSENPPPRTLKNDGLTFADIKKLKPTILNWTKEQLDMYINFFHKHDKSFNKNQKLSTRIYESLTSFINSAYLSDRSLPEVKYFHEKQMRKYGDFELIQKELKKIKNSQPQKLKDTIPLMNISQIPVSNTESIHQVTNLFAIPIKIKNTQE